MPKRDAGGGWNDGQVRAFLELISNVNAYFKGQQANANVTLACICSYPLGVKLANSSARIDVRFLRYWENVIINKCVYPSIS